MKIKLVAVAMITICLISLVGSNKMNFDNSTDKYDLITEKYSVQQIGQLKVWVESGRFTFSKFIKNFNAQCIRKTHQGYYVVLLSENNDSVFVFFNTENNARRIIITQQFMHKSDFEKHVVIGMTANEVESFDTNTIPMPISSVETTVHIVVEGAYIVRYTRFSNGKLTNIHTVESIEFVENKNLSKTDDLLVRNLIPYIFELDKTDK